MELNEIRYFLETCETLNFTRAAENCGVAVPTLTRAIKKLEDELGGQLFRRERRLTHLTDLGRLMQMHMAEARAAVQAAREEADRYASVDARLKMGVVSTVSTGYLVTYLRHLRDRAPSLDLDIWESHCADIAVALEKGEIDIAIMTLPEYPDGFRPIELFREPYFVAFHPRHRFSRLNAVPMREFEGEDYVKRLHCEFPSNLARLGIAKPYQEVRVRYSTEREDWVQAMVASGLGITLMPKYLPLLDGIAMRPVIEPEVHRTVSVVTHAGRRHSRPVAEALEAARHLKWDGEGGRTG